jgi:hypothetical protein
MAAGAKKNSTPVTGELAPGRRPAIESITETGRVGGGMVRNAKATRSSAVFAVEEDEPVGDERSDKYVDRRRGGGH